VLGHILKKVDLFFWLRVLKRLLFEFGPPALIAAILFTWRSWEFWATVFGASWFWGQFLRILHQQGQRDFQQDQRDFQDDVRSEFWSLKRWIGKSPVEREMQRKVPAPAASEDLKRMYFVDFRARTAASYGHEFTCYGRTDQKEVEVAGLHPASESIIPYILGHVVPVPSETGASYGDLDEKYLTASYRVLMDERQAARVFAYIKHLQATSPLWHAVTYNCVAFIQDIARTMGLHVPGNHLLVPEKWVAQLRALNGGGEIGLMPPSPVVGR
jgi:hypothetical protein